MPKTQISLRSLRCVSVCLLATLIGTGLSGCSSSAPSDSESSPPPSFELISPHDVRAKLSDLQGADWARAPMEAKVGHLVAKHGVDSVVGVLLEPFSNEHHRTVSDRMRESVGTYEHFSQWQGNRALYYVAVVPDVESFAAKLNLGESAVDVNKRIIRIRVDMEKLAEHAKSPGPRHKPFKK